MNIVVFDTETTSVEKPFCYNIGYVIYDTDQKQILAKKDFVVEQVWHNPMLFTTAYYSNKREIYVSRMRTRQTVMDKFGYICQTMLRDFKAFNVEIAYAYNSPFDDKVFAYNCEWFKCNNPFDNIEIKDIRAFVHNSIAKHSHFLEWCEHNEKFTESGNYSSTAETIYQYVVRNLEFVEEHTALADSLIELEILNYCIDNYQLDYMGEYKTRKSIVRNVAKQLTIVVDNEEFVYTYKTKRCYNDGQKIILKN